MISKGPAGKARDALGPPWAAYIPKPRLARKQDAGFEYCVSLIKASESADKDNRVLFATRVATTDRYDPNFLRYGKVAYCS